ncbi:hypothetical protein V9T40_014030 [Parthenolecanium corni]|uniref:Tumor suppressor candidate 2 n=1 Tax=Parthenolecanium corni TaxID=536013 RepID=A0AAN9TC71_9HEMI
MGSNGSKSKKSFSPGKPFGKEAKHDCNVNLNVPSAKKPNINLQYDSTVVKVPPSLSPFVVLYRQGSMYFDEDGDLAHEFYVEVKEGRKRKMKRVYNNLTPQGLVKLPCPRLHQDCPVVLYML